MKRLVIPGLLLAFVVVGCASGVSMSEQENKAFNPKTNPSGGKRDEKSAQAIADFKANFEKQHGASGGPPAAANAGPR